METNSYTHLILFDGDCGLCNRSLKFILKKEKNNKLYFSPLQSESSLLLLKRFGLTNRVATIVYIKNNNAYTKSGAALRICLELKGLWPLMMAFIIIPPFIRNAVYDYIATNRIKWFGTADYCEIMTPEIRDRFVVD